jgi:hypothetical protein
MTWDCPNSDVAFAWGRVRRDVRIVEKKGSCVYGLHIVQCVVLVNYIDSMATCSERSVAWTCTWL